MMCIYYIATNIKEIVQYIWQRVKVSRWTYKFFSNQIYELKKHGFTVPLFSFYNIIIPICTYLMTYPFQQLRYEKALLATAQQHVFHKRGFR